MVDLSSVWPQWGSSGSKPSDGKDYSGGDNPQADHYDYLWNYIRVGFGKVEDRLNAIDSDDDGVVDEADYANDADASTYKGSDIDSDGDGRVDYADTSQLVKGTDIDSDGDGVVNEADYANDADASTYKGSDIDSDGDGRVDAADDATTVKGSDIDSNGDGVVNKADYANDADASTYKGNDIDSDGDGVVDTADYANDTDTVDGQHASDLESSWTTLVHDIDNDGSTAYSATVDNAGDYDLYRITTSLINESNQDDDLLVRFNDDHLEEAKLYDGSQGPYLGTWFVSGINDIATLHGTGKTWNSYMDNPINQFTLESSGEVIGKVVIEARNI